MEAVRKILCYSRSGLNRFSSFFKGFEFMGIFHTILHPTDFDACSLEAFRVSRELGHQLGAKVVAFHVASPPAVVTEDGRVIMDPKASTPVDIWADYRAAEAAGPSVAIEYSVVVGKHTEATRMLVEMIGK